MAADALIADAARNPAPRMAPAASLLSLMSFSPIERALPACQQGNSPAVPDAGKNMQEDREPIAALAVDTALKTRSLPRRLRRGSPSVPEPNFLSDARQDDAAPALVRRRSNAHPA